MVSVYMIVTVYGTMLFMKFIDRSVRRKEMKKADRTQRDLSEARSLHSQGRWAEARVVYEKIITELSTPVRKKSK